MPALELAYRFFQRVVVILGTGQGVAGKFAGHLQAVAQGRHARPGITGPQGRAFRQVSPAAGLGQRAIACKLFLEPPVYRAEGEALLDQYGELIRTRHQAGDAFGRIDVVLQLTSEIDVGVYAGRVHLAEAQVIGKTNQRIRGEQVDIGETEARRLERLAQQCAAQRPRVVVLRVQAMPRGIRGQFQQFANTRFVGPQGPEVTRCIDLTEQRPGGQRRGTDRDRRPGLQRVDPRVDGLSRGVLGDDGPGRGQQQRAQRCKDRKNAQADVVLAAGFCENHARCCSPDRR